MALRSIHVMKGIIKDMEEVCPDARLFNYTNPINIVSEAVTHHTAIPVYSFCEGPMLFNPGYAHLVGLDHEKLDSVSIGLNHGSWSIRHLYDGQDIIPLLQQGYERLAQEGKTPRHEMRMLKLACEMESLPSEYFQYYYFKEEILAALQAKPTTRAQDIMAHTGDYWVHYREQAESDSPELDPQRSRGGIHELELAIDVMDAIYNDRKEIWYVNVPNQGAIKDFPDDLVVEMPGYVDHSGITPFSSGPSTASGERAGENAWRVPGSRRQSGLEWHPPRRHPRPGEQSAGLLIRQSRGHLRRTGCRASRLSARTAFEVK